MSGREERLAGSCWRLVVYSAAFSGAGSAGAAGAAATSPASLFSLVAGAASVAPGCSASDEVQRVWGEVSTEYWERRAGEWFEGHTKLSLRSCMMRVESL